MNLIHINQKIVCKKVVFILLSKSELKKIVLSDG